MNSVALPPDDHEAFECARLPLPMVGGKIKAGFPSPADDFQVKRHDLNELLIVHPSATFMWRVSGISMIEAGIFDNDILVVDRALTPAHKDIVVAPQTLWSKLFNAQQQKKKG